MSFILVLVGTTPTQQVNAVPSRHALTNGIDISWLTDVEKAGGKFYMPNNQATPAIKIMKDQGLSIGRIRIWVNKANGHASLKRALRLAERLKRQKMQIMINFHLSDIWADPGNQQIPATWSRDNQISLKADLLEYLEDSLMEFSKRDIAIDVIQIGNEIGNGFLWPLGRINSESDSQWKSFVELYNAAHEKVRVLSPNSKILLHLHNGGDAAWVQWWWNLSIQHGLATPDYVGVSYYPNWHGSLSDLQATLDFLQRQEQYIWIVETAYPWIDEFFGKDVINPYQAKLPGYPLSPKGQKRFIAKLEDMLLAMNHQGVGIVWWEGLAIHVGKFGKRFASGMQNATLFSDSGRMLPALKILGKK